MKNNLVFSPIEKLFKKNCRNIIIGKLDRQQLFLKKNYNILENNNDWSLKNRIRESAYLDNFYDKKISELYMRFNQIHGLSKNRGYWEIILGHFLKQLIFISRDRWLSVKKCLKNKKIDFVSIMDINYEELTTNNYLEFSSNKQKHYYNHYLFTEAYKILSSKEKIYWQKSEEKIIKKLKYKKKKFHNFNANSIYEALFHIFKKNQKYLFFDHYLNHDYILLNLMLFNLPFRYDEFNYYTKNININKLIRQPKLTTESKNNFENFFNKIFFELMPLSYLENFKKIVDYTSNINLNPDVVFTSMAHSSNDVFKIWAADKVSNGVKLVCSMHGGDLETYHEYNHNGHHKHIIWHKPASPSKKLVQLPPNLYINKEHNYHNKSKKILCLLTARYFYKGNISHKNGTELEHYNFIKKQIIKTFKDQINNFYFRIHPTTKGYDKVKKNIELDFGKGKVDETKDFEDIINKYKLIVDTCPETTYTRCFTSGVPTILLYKKIESVNVHKDIIDLFNKMKKNNLVFEEFESSELILNKILKDPFLWWNSKKILILRKKYSKLCCMTTNNDLIIWKNFFKNL